MFRFNTLSNLTKNYFNTAISYKQKNSLKFFKYITTSSKNLDKSGCFPGAKIKYCEEKPHEGGYKIWRNLAFLLGLPAIIACATNIVLSRKGKEEERPPFVKYEYLRRITKRWPWGEGVKSLFHNPHTNALPDGYEDEENSNEEKSNEKNSDEEKSNEKNSDKEK